MADLNGTTIAATYTGLLKTSDSGARGAEGSADQISDGRGNNTPLYLSATEVYALGSGAGTSHTAFGKDCGVDLSTGTGNALFGEGAGADLTTGEHNTAMGYHALFQGTTETDDNVAIGYNAMSGAWTTAAVNDCVVIGSGAGAGALVAAASGSTFIGTAAGAAITSGIGNTAIGHLALDAAATSDYNTAVGKLALSAVNGDGTGGNTAVGYAAADVITSGVSNTVVGTSSLGTASTALRNVAIGQEAMGDVKVGVAVADCVAIGFEALKGNSSNTTDIGGTIAIGTQAAAQVTTGARNIAIGYEALNDLEDGTDNVVIGYQAMTNVQAGGDQGTSDGSAKNVFMGSYAGGGAWADSVSQQNVGIGHRSMYGVMAAANNNVAVGTDTLKVITSGTQNVCVGFNAGVAVENGGSNTIVGSNAGTTMAGATANTFIGKSAGEGVLGIRNTVLGSEALISSNNDCDGIVAVGYGACAAVNGSGADYMVAIGYNAGTSIAGGAGNTIVGYVAGDALTSGGYNTIMGWGAGGATVDVDNGVFIGREAAGAGNMTSGADGTVAIGKDSLSALTSGSGNTSVGYLTLKTLTTGTGNTAIGNKALEDAATSGADVAHNNTCVGSQAGMNITYGIGNVCIGETCGTVYEHADANIIIGANANGSGATVGYEIALGYGITAAGTETCRIGRASDYITNDFGENATWTHSSDVRIKKDIEDNELGLDFINDIRTVTFKKKAPSEYPKEFSQHDSDITERKNPDRIHYGFIAQEVKKAMDKAGHPEFTVWSEDEDGMQELGEADFITPLIKAVQELSQQVEDLKAKIN